MATPPAASTRTRPPSGAGKTTVTRRGYPMAAQTAAASRPLGTPTSTAAPADPPSPRAGHGGCVVSATGQQRHSHRGREGVA